MTYKIVPAIVIIALCNGIAQSKVTTLYPLILPRLTFNNPGSDSIKGPNPFVSHLNTMANLYIADGWHILTAPTRINRMN